MGNITTDQKSPGARKVQRYNVGRGYDGHTADGVIAAEERGVGFLLLKNCLLNKRLGAVVRRPGSQTETITSSLGLPLGMGEFIASSNGQTIPTNRTLLVNFGGSQFWQNSAGTWTLVTQSAYVSFATSRQSTFCKLGSNMFIAGGLPARWGGPGTTIERVGLAVPTSPVTITSYDTGTGITLTSGTRYIVTTYNSTTGLESDWSEPSAAVPVISNKSIVIGLPAQAAGPYDQYRIYRYFDGGAYPYLVATVASSTTTYTDTKPDSQLTTRGAVRYDRLPPPTQAFTCAKYAQCIWLVDGSNPYKLVFSNPYTGSDNDLQYFPVNNYVISNEPITALLPIRGKMLVFHPRSISCITGTSVDDFTFQSYSSGAGTVFGPSVTSNGRNIAFLSEEGFVSLPEQGGDPQYLSREIDFELQTLMAGSYNSAIYVSGAWNPAMRQFIWTFMAQSTAGAPWEEVGTGSTATAVAGWQTTPGLVTDPWEDVSNPNTAASLRVKIWGWSPEMSSGDENAWHEYTFAAFADDNVTGAYPIFVYHPQPSADTGDPQQDKTLIGYWNGTQGLVLSAFRKDKNLDDSVGFNAEWITRRLSPGDDTGGYKLFQGIGFESSYSDPTADTSTTLKYLRDFEDPHLRSYASSLITISDTTEVKRLSQMKAKFIHLYGIDTAQSQTKILLSKFHIHYRERFQREA
jgi:hypothetical protein